MRVEYSGAIYHVLSRGDRREDIFLDDVDRQDFLKTLAEACQKTNFQVHAYCLMRNHFHLVIETPEANLVAGMRWLLREGTVGTGCARPTRPASRLPTIAPTAKKVFPAI
jgi:REP element-mobilizing transposase RayT